ncbi:HAD-like domain-containing protein [Microdochium trichocladiopsis]|uniref:Mitochondrial import inner membrane translocase subunit TIM50 n=1 Tax=Microdochium trichocladiopsis TaxID=1682393 RepID=A0A9P9BSJ0_9PEZI|nr:HAD-like domain-containing protein [Microdochium trichocladiopsis]KAH7034634.1 HAD-like domain-containing protein [Microdochium trichocladiopsis]
MATGGPQKPESTQKDKGQPAASKPEAPDAAPESEPIPDFSKLPDLTQGIPSTLEYELSSKAKKGSSKKPGAEEPAPKPESEPEPQPSSGGRPHKEMPSSAYETSTDRRRMKTANVLYLTAALGAFGTLGYLGRPWDEDEAPKHTDIDNSWSPMSWWARAVARQNQSLDYYREPAFEKLLPDPDPMFERPYTLCISLEDMLLHSEWTREHGWRVAKRPGVDYFLRYLSQYYELVLFTTVPFQMGDPLVRKLDPFRFIVWPLFREATKYKNGEIVKDLSYLNRDLSKVIIIDSKASHVQNQPENAIILPPWKGEKGDKELVSLIPFLEYIHTMQYKDTREVLKSFEGKHIPTEFARREAIARAEFNKQVEARKKRAPSGMAALGGLLGLKPSNMSMMVPAEGEQSASEAFASGKMLQDIARERGQRNYEMLEKEIRENGQKWLKEEQEAQEKAQAEAMSSMKTNFSGWFGSGDDSKK